MFKLQVGYPKAIQRSSEDVVYCVFLLILGPSFFLLSCNSQGFAQTLKEFCCRRVVCQELHIAEGKTGIIHNQIWSRTLTQTWRSSGWPLTISRRVPSLGETLFLLLTSPWLLGKFRVLCQHPGMHPEYQWTWLLVQFPEFHSITVSLGEKNICANKGNNILSSWFYHVLSVSHYIISAIPQD